MYYNKEGEPISMLQWADLMEDMEYRKVIESYLRGYHISTVWLGLNYNFFSDAPIHIFETMIFCEDKEDHLSYYMNRSSTINEAFESHKQAIDLAKDGK